MKTTKPDLSSSVENIDRLIEAYQAGGNAEVDAEFERIFPPSKISGQGLFNLMSKEEREKQAADPELQAKIRRIRAAIALARLDR